MIIGIGMDRIATHRIASALDRFDERMKARLFTDDERALCDSRHLCAACYAKRFAAKEAASKALGIGMRDGVRWRDIEVVRLASGQPSLRLNGLAYHRLQSLLPDGYEARAHLTITDDDDTAMAFVVLEAVRN